MHRPAYAVYDRVAHEFAMRGLVPPHCTPENLARALERERQITIVFQPQVAYLLAADILSRPLPSRLRCLPQPVMNPPNRFSTPRLSRLACI
jgi:hypothetical protein